jgi:hypothetical protein
VTIRLPFRLPLLAPLLLLSILSAFAAEPDGHALAGTWKIDLTRSTELSPWKSFELTITPQGTAISIERKLTWSRREFIDRLELDTTKSVNALPIDWWSDNRHLGAYIGSSHTREVRHQWLDGGRILRLSTDLVLDAQQGPRAVNILTDFKVSASGSELTLTELRSTRNRPVVYVFKRLPAK